MAREGRPLFRIILQNFINSFRPRKIKGNFIGEDYLGNKFYEIPANPALGQRKASRWFEPPGKKSSFEESQDPEDHGHELTAEWESWLRGRRKEPPTDEELKKNLAIMQIKKINAKMLDEKYGTGSKEMDHAALKQNEKTGKAEFPRYDEEYETFPGIKPMKKN